jgi:NitT/TauT family transport system permease protein
VRELQLPRFWTDVATSGQEFLAGYFLAVLLGVPFGLVTGWFRNLNYFFEPWLSAFNSTPRIALLPLVILWAGLGLLSKIVIIFLGAFFPVAINTFLGVRTVDRSFVEVAATFGASRWKRMTTVVLPSVLPFILVGMRIAVGRSVAGVIVGEFYQSNAGLGNMIFKAGQALQTDRLLFGALFMTVLALVFFQIIATLEARVRAWRPRVGSA